MGLHTADEGTQRGYLDPSQSATCNMKTAFLSPEVYSGAKLRNTYKELRTQQKK